MPSEPTPVSINIEVNGTPINRAVPANRLLIDLLRVDLGLTGTKENCSIGVCGACSVLVDGQLMSACLLLAAATDGRAVTTIEGFAGADGQLTGVQRAFLDHGGFQCGFCTPGQVVAATGLLSECPEPSEEDVRDWMSGNLCRCTGYRGIVASVLAAAEEAQVRPESPSAGASAVRVRN